MVDSKELSPFGYDLACTLGSEMLKKNKGKLKFNIWELGPAKFNRLGEDTSVTHILALFENIMLKRGFAHYRYDCLWTHSPNPRDPLEVYDHGQSMRSRNVLLPDLPKKALKGTFRRVHLMTGMQMTDEGGRTLPISGKALNKGIANSEAMDVFEHGLWCLHFDYEDVKENLEDFKNLMASDNWEADLVLGDNEVSLAVRMIKLIHSTAMKGKQGSDLDRAVIAQVKATAGEKFGDQDLKWLLNWAKTTSIEVADVLQPLQKFLVDPVAYAAPTQQFNWITGIPPECQWLRSTQFVRMYSADPNPEKGEIKIVNGKVVSNALSLKHIETMNKNIVSCKDSETLQHLEKTINKIVNLYWSMRPASVSANDVLSHVGALLKKVAVRMYGSNIMRLLAWSDSLSRSGRY